jgi:hypothetical protein
VGSSREVQGNGNLRSLSFIFKTTTTTTSAMNAIVKPKEETYGCEYVNSYPIIAPANEFMTRASQHTKKTEEVKI